MTPLNIVHYCPGIRFEFGGVVRAVLDNCNVLSRRGHRVTLVTYDSPDIPPDFDGSPSRPRVVNIPSAAGPNGFITAEALAQFERLLQPGEVLHLHCPWTLSNLQVAKIARRKQIPYVFSTHGMLDHWAMSQRNLKKRLFLMAIGRRLMRRAARIHYTAQAEHDQAIHYVGNSPSCIIPYIVDLAPFESPPGRELAYLSFPDLATDVPNVLFLSRLHEKKGVDLLIRATDLLHKQSVPFRLLIAGSGDPAYKTKLKSLVELLQLQSVVRFVGLVGGIEKIALFRAADVFVLPTLQENFGLVLVESLAAGTPVLTTPGTDIWQEIRSAGGRICLAEPAHIAHSLSEMLADRPALGGLGQRGRAWVFDHLSIDVIAAQYEQMYAKVLAEGTTLSMPPRRWHRLDHG